LKVAGAKAISPAHGVNVRFFVEVVAVLTDVVQGGEDGGVVPPPALVRHPSIPFTADHVPRILGDQREEGVIRGAGQGQCQ